jgi:hypothetical protein
MRHVIRNKLYKIISAYGVPQYVEADNLNDLFEHIIDNYLFNGMKVAKVLLIEYDGTQPEISLSKESFGDMLKEKINSIKDFPENDAEILLNQYC